MPSQDFLSHAEMVAFGAPPLSREESLSFQKLLF